MPMALVKGVSDILTNVSMMLHMHMFSSIVNFWKNMKGMIIIIYGNHVSYYN